MWIELTCSDGQPMNFNLNHLIALKDHGEHTLIIHSTGEELVLESRAAINAALRGSRADYAAPFARRRPGLHS